MIMISVFPDLKNDPNFDILSEPTREYNCIAWAMGFNDRWVAPAENSPGVWWPAEVELEMSPKALVRAFEAVGFVMCDDGQPEEGFDKVVLYKNPETDEWTHAARIISATTEYSKFGPMWDATHSHDVLFNTGDQYADQSYGKAYAYMKRPDSYNKGIGQVSGSVEINMEELSKYGLLLNKYPGMDKE